jgi:uncharacterized protein YoaH (UPF0181 family)
MTCRCERGHHLPPAVEKKQDLTLRGMSSIRATQAFSLRVRFSV